MSRRSSFPGPEVKQRMNCGRSIVMRSREGRRASPSACRPSAPGEDARLASRTERSSFVRPSRREAHSDAPLAQEGGSGDRSPGNERSATPRQPTRPRSTRRRASGRSETNTLRPSNGSGRRSTRRARCRRLTLRSAVETGTGTVRHKLETSSGRSLPSNRYSCSRSAHPRLKQPHPGKRACTRCSALKRRRARPSKTSACAGCDARRSPTSPISCTR